MSLRIEDAERDGAAVSVVWYLVFVFGCHGVIFLATLRAEQNVVPGWFQAEHLYGLCRKTTTIVDLTEAEVGLPPPEVRALMFAAAQASATQASGQPPLAAAPSVQLPVQRVAAERPGGGFGFGGGGFGGAAVVFPMQRPVAVMARPGAAPGAGLPIASVQNTPGAAPGEVLPMAVWRVPVDGTAGAGAVPPV